MTTALIPKQTCVAVVHPKLPIPDVGWDRLCVSCVPNIMCETTILCQQIYPPSSENNFCCDTEQIMHSQGPSHFSPRLACFFLNSESIGAREPKRWDLDIRKRNGFFFFLELKRLFPHITSHRFECSTQFPCSEDSVFDYSRYSMNLCICVISIYCTVYQCPFKPSPRTPRWRSGTHQP